MKKLVLILFLISATISLLAQRRMSNTAPSPSHGDVGPRYPYTDLDSKLNPKINGEINQIKSPLDLTTEYLLSHVQSYPIVIFNPQITQTDSIRLPEIQKIRIIDGRFDIKKVGFFPSDHSFQEKSLFMVGLQLQGNLAGWLKDNFIDKNLVIDSNNTSNRELVILLKQFWYSFSANTALNAKTNFISTLHYRFDIFSSKDAGYYPLKKMEGTFSAIYNDSKVYNLLTDSLLLSLKKLVTKLPYASFEKEKNWIAPADFIDYCNKDLKRIQKIEENKKGLYASYEDFIGNKPIADSIVMVKKYNNSGFTTIFACQIAPYQKGEPLSGTKAWGYYDGVSLFVNIGNGFYIKLILSGEDYLFLFLKNMGYDKIKTEMQDHLFINDTPYKLLKNYTKQYSLVYKLNYENGKLF
ncbi:MAG: hypothetical protein WCJ80_13875 [Bacteroidota bacterium]